jgi:hypothetical protein
MAVPPAIQSLFQETQKKFNAKQDFSKDLTKLKIELAKLSNQLIKTGHAADHLVLGQQVYEMGALDAIRRGDLAGFEREVRTIRCARRNTARGSGGV